MSTIEEDISIYKAYDTPTGHEVMVKNTQDEHLIGFTSISDAMLHAGDPHGLHYGIRHYEGKTYVTEVTDGQDSMMPRGFKVLDKPMYVYSYPSVYANDIQKDGTMKINRQTRGTCILTPNNALNYLTENSQNLVFVSFNEAQNLPETQRLYLETRPSAAIPKNDFESCIIC